MDLFERLQEEGLVSEGGRMRGCMPELYDGVESGTLVREMILNEDSEQYLVYDDQEREEFLFRIFKHLVIGGGMCQPEENISPYLDCTKKLYKSLLNVKKHATTGKLQITSTVIAIKSVEGMGLFPSESDHNLCYLIVDAARRRLTYWYNAHVSMW